VIAHDVIVLNVHSPSENRNYDTEEQERIFDHFTKYHVKIMLGDYNERWGEKMFSNRHLRKKVCMKFRNANAVREVNLATTEHLTVKSTMFPHSSIHKYTCTSPDGKTIILITSCRQKTTNSEEGRKFWLESLKERDN
jgi:hypothetical protein